MFLHFEVAQMSMNQLLRSVNIYIKFEVTRIRFEPLKKLRKSL